MVPSFSRIAKSDVESFVGKLSTEDQSHVSQQMICAAEEVLRKVAVKVKQGAMGRTDSIECRAAIILDLVLRRSGKPGITSLHKLCGIKRKDLENMSMMISNYIKDTPKAVVHSEINAPSQQSPRKPPINLQSEGGSMIPIISVKIGSYVSDSLGLSKRAEILFRDIKTHVASIEDKFKRLGYLQDMDRKNLEYEAVCFFLIMEENLVDDKEELKSILIDAANIQRNEFENIYMVAKEFYRIMRLHRRQLRPLKSRECKRRKLEDKVTATVLDTNLSKIVEPSSQHTAIYKQTEKKLEPETSSKYQYNETFQQWKANTIQVAIEKSKLTHGNISDSQAVHHAATLILDKMFHPKVL
jgi:hypothetical protein